MNKKKILINVSGHTFETLECTLNRYPDTLLGDELKRNKFFCHKSKQIFFDRNRISFEAILFFYQSQGRLSCPPELSIDVFVKECRYFEISDKVIKRMIKKAGYLEQKKIHTFPNIPFSRKIWNFIEYNDTSTSALIFALTSSFMIVMSVVIMCLDSVPSIRNYSSSWSRHIWVIGEGITNAWFLIELLVRFCFCPNKKKFLKKWLNIIDAITVICYLLMLALKDYRYISYEYLHTLRLARVLKLFRITKHSKRLQIATIIIKSSMRDLRSLLFCLILLNIFGASIIYIFENSFVHSQFKSIPHSLWWAIQTIVTLGYGDIVPMTIPGKIFAASFMSFGALTISLPVLSIVTKFSAAYTKNLKSEP
ncbi:potassium voltage-gated channel subfamily A member 2 [Hydra vulgaris]|uniref:potassium voltage-gated channel subfamily A member 2 n=1 Tax=Hydra vulgaris TaxID=6087 RepID=UPI001F5F5860|nr:potassium voltage-gated channel subfamily A member 2-like [Hydra vulgaris]